METNYDLNTWKLVSGKLKLEFPQLTDSDLLWRHGSWDELLRMIAYKLGKTRKELQDKIALL